MKSSSAAAPRDTFLPGPAPRRARHRVRCVPRAGVRLDLPRTRTSTVPVRRAGTIRRYAAVQNTHAALVLPSIFMQHAHATCKAMTPMRQLDERRAITIGSLAADAQNRRCDIAGNWWQHPPSRGKPGKGKTQAETGVDMVVSIPCLKIIRAFAKGPTPARSAVALASPQRSLRIKLSVDTRRGRRHVLQLGRLEPLLEVV